MCTIGRTFFFLGYKRKLIEMVEKLCEEKKERGRRKIKNNRKELFL